MQPFVPRLEPESTQRMTLAQHAMQRILSSRAWRWSSPLRGAVKRLAPVRYASAKLSILRSESTRFDPARHLPRLFLSTGVSRLCNYRCTHCHIWTQRDPENGLTTDQRVDVIHQYAALNPKGRVIFPGGEVTMDMPELLALAAACRQHRLDCHINTNGSSVTTIERARELVQSGITSIEISLDSHLPEIHRYTRGIETAYEDTLRAIRLLVSARDRWQKDVQLAVGCVVFDQNIRLLPDYIDFTRALGVDHATFQILSPTFANRHPDRDVFWKQHFFHTAEAKAEACRLLDEVVRRYSDGFLSKRPGDLEWIKRYVMDPTSSTGMQMCGSHEKNMVIDSRGNVALCFNQADVLPDEPRVGHVLQQSLRQLWMGESSARARDVMNQCRLACGALDCHRRS